jgi:hypothetical protein
MCITGQSRELAMGDLAMGDLAMGDLVIINIVEHIPNHT